MGANVCKRTSSKREAKALITKNNVWCSSQGSSIIESINPDGSKKMKTKKNQKGPLQSPEKRITKTSKLTLEDWLLASPGPAGLQPDSLSGGELYVFKHSSRRVHPSSSIRAREAVMVTPTDGFSMDNSVYIPSSSCSSFNRSQSGKPKKKVSFRLPEEADSMIFYSPVEALAKSDQAAF